jgi:hypothetical protein
LHDGCRLNHLSDKDTKDRGLSFDVGCSKFLNIYCPEFKGMRGK